jgi:hypothetical protein
LRETNPPDARQLDMRTFYALNVHRKDGSWHRHLMRGELPKPGDTVPAILSREEAVMAKVAGLSELTLVDEEHSIVAAKVDADEV